MRWCLCCPHFGQPRLGRNAAVHHPGAPGLAILGFDPSQEVAQRRFVRGVAGHYLVGQRQAIWRHDQGDDDLDAVGPFVPAVAMPSLAGFGWITLEVRAGQIVKQDSKFGLEQGLPTLLQETEQFGLVRQQLVEAAIQIVLLHQAEVLAQQIPHRTVFIPLPMQPPFTARIDQSISDQRLQHVQPARCLP
jgi:hypothetical protein